ncbi:MAG: acyl carrier protein [Prevotella sp.]|jgi:acyl carrier protein|nr:acyl carrier protein [Prevotella sp.]
MTRQEITDKINEFLTEELEIDSDKVTPEANLREEMGIDSLDYVDIVAFVAKTFGYKIKAEEFKQITTLGEFYDYIESKL